MCIRDSPRSKYTVTADKLNMKKSGQTHLTVKSNSSSLWDNSAYAQFVIDVVGDDDIAQMCIRDRCIHPRIPQCHEVLQGR